MVLLYDRTLVYIYDAKTSRLLEGTLYIELRAAQ
jgi:hypothetical protein